MCIEDVSLTPEIVTLLDSAVKELDGDLPAAVSFEGAVSVRSEEVMGAMHNGIPVILPVVVVLVCLVLLIPMIALEAELAGYEFRLIYEPVKLNNLAADVALHFTRGGIGSPAR